MGEGGRPGAAKGRASVRERGREGLMEGWSEGGESEWEGGHALTGLDPSHIGTRYYCSHKHSNSLTHARTQKPRSHCSHSRSNSNIRSHCSHSHSNSSSSQVLPYSRYRFSHASLPLAIAISPASLSATESTTSDSSYSVYGKTPPGGDREKDRGRNQGKPAGARALVDCAI
jgi:hypothetical protein